MMNWKKVKLGEVCSYQKKSSIKAGDGNITGLYPFFTSSTEQTKFIDNYQFDEPSLIFGTGGKASVHYCAKKFAVSTDCLVAKANNYDEVFLKFVYFYLSGNITILENGFKGAGLKHISKDYISNLEIPLPDLATQQHIAQVLDQADALRQQNRQLLGYYDELLQSTFIDLFGDPVKNEKGWEVKKLREVSEVVSGVAKNGNLNGDLIEAPYMRVANVQDGQLNLSEIKTINVFKKDFDKYQLKNNDILMTEGGDPDKLGRAAIWKEQIKSCIHQNHIFRVRPDFLIIDSCYLCLLVGSGYGKRYFLKAAKQTTGIASINITQLKNFPVIIPPLPLQQHFAKIVEEIEAQKSLVQQSLAESEALFEGLLAEYFG